MRKVLRQGAVALAFCFGMTTEALAIEHSKRESLDVKYAGGSYNEVVAVNGTLVSQNKVPLRGLDVDLMVHRRFLYLSYGLVGRQRMMTTPTGTVSFTGAGASIGFVTNTFEDPQRWPVGLHAHLCAVVGGISKVSGAYKQDSITAFSDGELGADLLLHGWKTPDGKRYKSALVATVGVSGEATGVSLSTRDVKPLSGSMTARGKVTKFGLSWYW